MNSPLDVWIAVRLDIPQQRSSSAFHILEQTCRLSLPDLVLHDAIPSPHSSHSSAPFVLTFATFFSILIWHHDLRPKASTTEPSRVIERALVRLSESLRSTDSLRPSGSRRSSGYWWWEIGRRVVGPDIGLIRCGRFELDLPWLLRCRVFGRASRYRAILVCEERVGQRRGFRNLFDVSLRVKEERER